MEIEGTTAHWNAKKEYRCVVHDGEVDWLVEVEWRKTGRRLEPKRVSISCNSKPAQPVTAAVVGRIPLGLIQREARRHLVSAAKTLRPLLEGSLPPRFARVLEAHVALADAAIGPKRGSALTDSDLEAVATIYKNAADSGWPVTKAVADALHVSPSTAGKRIMRARAAGLLDDYQNGQPT